MTDLVDDLLRATPKKKPQRALVLDLWEQQLLKDPKTQAVKKLIANVVLVMRNAEPWRGAIAWDEFAERVVITKQCPAGSAGPWSDLADIRTAEWLQRSRFRIDASPKLVAESVQSVADACRVHPLRERLSTLKWDGVKRVDTWTTRYLGAEDTRVHREIGARWMLGAVSRAFAPGSQVDCALILEGDQGRGKSSAVRILSLGFFTDELADVGNKDAAMQLHGAWIIELAELDAVGRAEASRVKSFLTRRADRYRSPYGRHVAEHPRQCVFAGTVNHNDYLRDETGGRRFMPVEVGTIDLAALRADVEQLWAEAVARYRGGEPCYTTDEELRTLIGAHTATRYQGDAWSKVIEEHVQLFESASVAECLERVGVERGRWTNADQSRVSKILKSLGYVRRQVRTTNAREWRYFKRETAVVTSNLVTVVTPASNENQSSVTTVTTVTTTNNINNHISPQELMGQGGDTVTGGDVVTAAESGHAFADMVGSGDDEA
jgi:putative DNA primase/helicase